LSDCPKQNQGSQSIFKDVRAKVIRAGKIIQNRGILLIITINSDRKHQKSNAAEEPRGQSVSFQNARFLVATFVCGMSVAGILVLRNFGILQSLELSAFDYLVRLRPAEKPDPRILVVAITESDIQRRKEWPLSDRTLAQLLTKLEKLQPRVIGLDIFRDFPVKTGYEELLPHLRNSRLIGTCAASERGQKDVSAPSGVPSERLGFSDMVVDDDGILRRHLLAMQPEQKSTCRTTESLSFQLALHYLAA
jgi:CHASE2 domain-containing sensor protein